MSLSIELSWSEFKTAIAAGLPYNYIDRSGNYIIYAVDGPITYSCLVPKNSDSDQAEFEATYKAAASSTYSQFDTDGAAITRVKAAKKGWTYQALGFEFSTSTLSTSLYCKDHTGSDISGISLKLYDGNDAEITTAGVANANLLMARKTVIDFEPTYDYELIGGTMRTATTITDNMRLWIVAVPDIAAPTGSKVMANGIALKYLTPGNVMDMDGRVSKYLSYNATYHTNKLRLILTYSAGVTEDLAIVLEHYKQ